MEDDLRRKMTSDGRQYPEEDDLRQTPRWAQTLITDIAPSSPLPLAPSSPLPLFDRGLQNVTDDHDHNLTQNPQL